MILSSTHFFNGVAHDIRDDQTKKMLASLIEAQLGHRISTFRKHTDLSDDAKLKMLSSHAHLASLQTDGSKFLLLFTRIDSSNCCVFIDRRKSKSYTMNRMILAHFQFDDSIFENTLLAGELTSSSSSDNVFIINDVLSWRGDRLVDVNLLKRIGIAHDILSRFFRPDIMDCCAFQVKAYVPFCQVRQLILDCNEFEYPCVAIVLKPMFCKFEDISFEIPHETRLRMRKPLKIKAKSMSMPENVGVCKDSHPNTEFFVARTCLPDVYELRLNPHTVCPDRLAAVPSTELSKLLKRLTTKTGVSTVSMSCEWSAKFTKWVPLPMESPPE